MTYGQIISAVEEAKRIRKILHESLNDVGSSPSNDAIAAAVDSFTALIEIIEECKA